MKKYSTPTFVEFGKAVDLTKGNYVIGGVESYESYDYYYKPWEPIRK